MNRDPFPRQDGDFDDWVRPCGGYVVTNGPTLGIKPAILAKLPGRLAIGTLTYAAATHPATGTRPAVAEKNGARAALDNRLGPF